MSTKRFVALVMALAMLFTLTAPAFTFAEGETSYQITIESTSNGSVTTQPANEAAEGEEVTLTVSPADGYHLEALTVKDASDQKVTVTNNKFTMPASNVTIRATFEADPVPEEPAAEEPANEEPTDGGDESGDGGDAQATDLDQHENDRLAEEGPAGGRVPDHQARDAHGGGGGEEGVLHARPPARRGRKGQHQQPGAQ